MPAKVRQLDLEYALESSFVTGLRAVFKFDDAFPYIHESAETKLLITSTFPEKDHDMKIPQIIVSVGGLQINQTSFYNNYHGDIIKDGVVIGKRFATNIPYSVSLVCLASKDGTAKDLANKVFKYISFTTSEIFNDDLRLNIQSVGRSSGGPQRQMPDKAFGHTVSVSGVLNWIGTKIQTEETRNILQKMKVELQLLLE